MKADVALEDFLFCSFLVKSVCAPRNAGRASKEDFEEERIVAYLEIKVQAGLSSLFIPSLLFFAVVGDRENERSSSE